MGWDGVLPGERVEGARALPGRDRKPRLSTEYFPVRPNMSGGAMPAWPNLMAPVGAP